MEITYHPRFERRYRKMSLEAKNEAELKEKIFRKNPFDTRLKAHKLKGKLKNHWSFSVTSRCRILFIFQKEDVIFLDIGDHKIYQ